MTAVTDEDVRLRISTNLRSLRGVRSYSDIARESGTSAGAIRDIELGLRTPGIGLVARIAKALGVTMDALLQPVKKSSKSA